MDATLAKRFTEADRAYAAAIVAAWQEHQAGLAPAERAEAEHQKQQWSDYVALLDARLVEEA